MRSPGGLPRAPLSDLPSALLSLHGLPPSELAPPRAQLEASADLPLPVACKEAVNLCLAYSGGEHESHRHVHGLLSAYARERLGRHGSPALDEYSYE